MATPESEVFPPGRDHLQTLSGIETQQFPVVLATAQGYCVATISKPFQGLKQYLGAMRLQTILVATISKPFQGLKHLQYRVCSLYCQGRDHLQTLSGIETNRDSNNHSG